MPKLSAFWVKNFHLANSFTFKIIALILFLTVCYLFRTKRKISTLDVLILYIYFRYRFFPELTPKINGISLELWPFTRIHRFEFVYADLFLAFYVWALISFVIHKILRRHFSHASGFLYLDLPIKDLAKLNKTPLIDQDKYSREKFAEEIVQSIEIMRPYKAFSIGISGEWGSGKSSLFDLIKEKLNKSSKSVEVLEFSPWYSSNTDALIMDFFKLLESNFQSNRILIESITGYVRGLSTLEKSFFKTDFFKDGIQGKENLKESYSKIAEELACRKKITVIIIDDLDRLNRKEVISVLKLIRVIADFPNVIYLVAYDRQYVNSAIKKELTDHLPDKFVDKIFNMEFTIPEASPDKILDQLIFHLLESLKLIEIHKNDKDFKKHFKYVKIEYFIRTQRDVKRFCNNFLISYKPIKDDGVDFETFLLLQLINYKNLEIFKSIYDKRDEILEYIISSKKEKGENTRVTPSVLLKLNSSEDPISTLIDIIFNSKTEYKMSSKFNFHKYFSLTLFGNEIKGLEVEELLKLDEEDSLKRTEELFKISDKLLTDILAEKLQVISALKYEELEKYLKILLFVYSEYQKRYSQSISDEDSLEEINESLTQLSKITNDLLSNSNLKNKYISFDSVFNKGQTDTNVINNYIKSINKHSFKTISLVSDRNTIFLGSPQWPEINTNMNASIAFKTHTLWEKNEKQFPILEKSFWLTARDQITKEEALNGGKYLFSRDFNLEVDPFFLDEAKLYLLADDFCTITLNSKNIGKHAGFETLFEKDIKEFLVKGPNSMKFELENKNLLDSLAKDKASFQKIFQRTDLGEKYNPYGLKFVIKIK